MANNRLICWRAVRLSDKKMIYGQLLQFGDRACIFENPDTPWAVDVDTKGQFIGIQDKNGKHIYEGDLVIIETIPHVIVYKDCGFVAKHYQHDLYMDLVNNELEVVGVYCASDLELILNDMKKKLAVLSGDGEVE